MHLYVNTLCQMVCFTKRALATLDLLFLGEWVVSLGWGASMKNIEAEGMGQVPKLMGSSCLVS